MRRRKVRVIVDMIVQVFSIVVVRWRCSTCHARFTDLPAFLLPYRRYAADSLLPLVAQYLNNDGQSYQRVAAPNGRVRGYVTPDGQERIDERALHRSTVLRWALFLGGQTATLEAGLQLWMERDPLTTIHHFAGAVSPRKFRSEQRAERLRTARRLLHFIAIWDLTFSEKFFPRFATRPRDS